MNNQQSINMPQPEGFVVEVDGRIESEYGTLMGALRAGLELRQKFPHRQVKVHDADEIVHAISDKQSAA